VHYLNKTAAIVFEFCDGKRDQDEIVSRIANAFELPATAHDEIFACLKSLMKEGLVQTRSG
jgi:hypothetical protein